MDKIVILTKMTNFSTISSFAMGLQLLDIGTCS